MGKDGRGMGAEPWILVAWRADWPGELIYDRVERFDGSDWLVNLRIAYRRRVWGAGDSGEPLEETFGRSLESFMWVTAEL